MDGKVVTEEEVAIGLGFANVTELKRWETELGQKNAELEHAIYTAKNDLKNFGWHGRRMMVVLEKAKEYIAKGTNDEAEKAKLELAIGVVTNKAVDWKHVLKDWFQECNEWLNNE